jgi:putative membrane protein
MLAGNSVIELVIRWLLLAAAVWVAAEIVSGIQLEGIESILIVGAILGVLNLYIKPVLMALTFPLTILTLGLFVIVINALLLLVTDWLAGEIDGINFNVDDFLAALLGALVISIVNMVLDNVIRPARFA